MKTKSTNSQSLVRQIENLTKQRDALAYALEMIRDADNDCHLDGLQTIPPAARHSIDMALDTLKGGDA